MRAGDMFGRISKRDKFVCFDINELIRNKKAQNTRFKNYLGP